MAPEQPNDVDDRQRMPLSGHLDELRRRLIYALIGLVVGVAAMLFLAPYLIWALKYPYVETMNAHGLAPDLSVLDAKSGVKIYMKVALYAGLVVAAPWIFYHIWMFVSAGLHRRERRYVVFAVPFSAGLFIAGSVFFLFAAAKPMLYFFIAINKWLGLESKITFENHVGFMVQMMVIFGLGFQTPLLVLILGWMGVVTTKTLNKYRRHVIVVMFILGAALTSPSPIDQVLLAVPMWLLYELGVLLVYLLVTRKRRNEEGVDTE